MGLLYESRLEPLSETDAGFDGGMESVSGRYDVSAANEDMGGR